MLSIQNVWKRYRTSHVETTVLRGISLSVEKGEYLAIMGPSGSGKTTLLNILGMIDVYTEGEYELNGQRVDATLVHQRAQLRADHFAFVFQSFHLVEYLSVLDNVLLPLRGRKDRRLLAKAVPGLLESLGLSARARHFPKELSGGQKQRVAIARALITDPDIIFADEPTGNLDSKTGSDVIGLLQGIRRDRDASIVLVTHSDEVASSADRVLTMKDGVLHGEVERSKMIGVSS